MKKLFDGELAVKQKLEDLQAKANQIFQGQLKLPEFEVTLDIDHVQHLGAVEYDGHEHRITGKITVNNINMHLSPYLLEEFKEEYVEHVIPHEFAHVIMNTIFSHKQQREQNMDDHGREFKIICQQLGYPHVGDAGTNLFAKSQFMNAKNINGRPYFEYRCECKQHKIGSANHVKMQAGGECKCKNCGTKLVKDI